MGTAQLCSDFQLDADREDIYLPTPEEIRAACLVIQAEWTESERSRRARGLAGRVRGTPLPARCYTRLLIDRRSWDERVA